MAKGDVVEEREEAEGSSADEEAGDATGKKKRPMSAAKKKKSWRKTKDLRKEKQDLAVADRKKTHGFDDAETRQLEAIVFGRTAVDALDDAKKDAERLKGKEKSEEKLAKKRKAEEEEDEAPAEKKAAWADPDDENVEINLMAQNRTIKLQKRNHEKAINGVEYEKRLREQFVKIHGHVSWTEQKPEAFSSDSEAEEEQAIATSSKMISDEPGSMLKPHELNIKRVKNVPVTANNLKGPAVIEALQFHPSSELMLAAGLDRRLHLHAVDGDENPKVSSHFFKTFPIAEASFLPSGDQILMTSMSWKMWGLDVHTGEPIRVRPLAAQTHNKFYGLAVGAFPGDAPGLRSSQMFSVLGDCGSALVCDAATKHPVRTLRMRTKGMAQVFSTQKDTLFTADEECNVYEWDLGSGRCIQRLKDIWATKITRLAMSRTSAHSPTPILAVGTASGNVDLFDVGGPKMSQEPTNSIGNLTTRGDWLKFHPSGEMLACSSRMKKEALKLVHVRTSTVYQNWPAMNTLLHRVSCVDFSRRDGLMAVGNERGKVLVYQLPHFMGGPR